MVPKINVYLSDELADAVKEAGLPVSAICQRALEQAVDRITAIRETVIIGGATLRHELDDPSNRFARFTDRARTVLALAIDDASAGGAAADTSHVLSAILAEGGNLAIGVLKSMEIEPDELAATLNARRSAGEPAAIAAEASFDTSAQEALRLAATESTSLGHNYVGCEHLLLGLVAEPDGTAGQLLRSMGVDLRLTRRAVAAALAGYSHLQANAAAKSGGRDATINQQLAAIITRLDRLESRPDTLPTAS
jgi:ATP-dependent Clp protease ATP-binding subunit ClpA